MSWKTFRAVALIMLFVVVMTTVVVVINVNKQKDQIAILEMEVERLNSEVKAMQTPKPVFVYGESQYIPTKGISKTKEEIELLAERIAHECSNSTSQEMYAVGCSILNRVESDDFPDTLEEVLNQNGQYSELKQVSKTGEVYKKAREVAYDLIWNDYRPLPKSVVLFKNREWVINNNYGRVPVYTTENLYYYSLPREGQR